MDDIHSGDRVGPRPATKQPARVSYVQHCPEEGYTMLNFFKSFANDEAGAVTVDWVVLTAAIVGIGVAVMIS